MSLYEMEGFLLVESLVIHLSMVGPHCVLVHQWNDIWYYWNHLCIECDKSFQWWSPKIINRQRNVWALCTKRFHDANNVARKGCASENPQRISHKCQRTRKPYMGTFWGTIVLALATPHTYLCVGSTPKFG